MSTSSLLVEILYRRYEQVTLDLFTAGREIGYKTKNSVYSARCRGNFPLPILDIGGRLGVSILDLAEFLESRQPIHTAPDIKHRAGRPSKKEQKRRAAVRLAVAGVAA